MSRQIWGHDLRLWSLLGLLCGAGCGGKLKTRTLVRPGDETAGLVFRDVSVFTATEGGLLTNQDVVVSDGRISALRPTGAALPEGARVVEGAGRTLLPGLIDAHVHTSGSGAGPWAPQPPSPEHNLEAMLYCGVTSVIDMGGHATLNGKLRQRVRSGEIPGPRMVITHGGITSSGGHPIPAAHELLPGPMGKVVGWVIPKVDEPDEAERVVAGAVKKGSDFIKIMYDEIPNGSPQMNQATLAAMIEASHHQGLRAYVHVGTPEAAVEAVRAGADLLAHGPYEGALSPTQAAEIAAAGVPVVYTLVAYERGAQLGDGAVEPTRLERETMPSEVLDGTAGEAGRAILDYPIIGGMSELLGANRANWTTSIRNLEAAGVPILAGTDATFIGVWPGSALHQELALLVEAGLSPTQALLGATALAAPWVDPDADFGTIAVDQAADLLLVEGDPTRDIHATRQIVMVVQDGQQIERLLPGEE